MDKVPFMQRGNVIYAIPCHTRKNDCIAKYIGRTTTTLQRRMNKHKSDFQCNPTTNSLFLHTSMQKCKHTVQFLKPCILDHSNYRRELPIREAWAIQANKHPMNQASECAYLPGPYHGLSALPKDKKIKSASTNYMQPPWKQ